MTLDEKSLDLIFLKARTQNGWLPTPVTDGQLRAIYRIMRSGPTSANSCPARILFVRTPDAKARLLPALSPGNVDKTKAAPVTAIIGYDTRFYELLPKLFPPRLRSLEAPTQEVNRIWHVTTSDGPWLPDQWILRRSRRRLFVPDRGDRLRRHLGGADTAVRRFRLRAADPRRHG